jgi:3-dehydroquinate dehydratase-2
MKKILVIQGANMEYLGHRNPELYGRTTAKELDEILLRDADGFGLALDIYYTNVEGEAIDRVYRSVREGFDGVIINPAGFLYAGYALRDCLREIPLPVIEVHMTNIHARGSDTVTAAGCNGVIAGLGVESYRLALIAIQRLLERDN